MLTSPVSTAGSGEDAFTRKGLASHLGFAFPELCVFGNCVLSVTFAHGVLLVLENVTHNPEAAANKTPVSSQTSLPFETRNIFIWVHLNQNTCSVRLPPT